MTILAIETSCDDTCAAVVAADGTIRSNVISSQQAHERFGGVVPEIASRHHLELIDLVVERALEDADITLDDVELVAATQGPGLIGALLVGFSSAKALAAARRLPFAAVDHLQGHVSANFLVSEAEVGDAASEGAALGYVAFEPPFLCLIASGGHTLLANVQEHEGFQTLGRTLDDAAGEAFDKGARMLGLGFPGGPALQRLAADGDPEAFEFPTSGSRHRGGRGATRAFGRSLDFSFAGLKTSLLYKLRELNDAQRRGREADLAASYQAAIVEHLIVRTEEALELTGLDRLAVGGGVAANGELRRRLQELGVSVHVPPAVLCTDNAAMIASAARFARVLSYPDYLGLDAYATGERP
ncbi:MAG TPA: tRNA (adenosine(37)-N6)-threonylcarbamoyltransferase complex transferase subunit TsaD [Solirubrobacteraceae bacterium]|jgi:N6-L-threonylcarbamoyladenine synthase|nr:tRNA (adenosine(37)-N6)-threonylcarbamoyltransferase complex transferase subunit TsaD [Solirubrobacteraceae bacterium]